jgi:hypothetical protein
VCRVSWPTLLASLPWSPVPWPCLAQAAEGPRISSQFYAVPLVSASINEKVPWASVSSCVNLTCWRSNSMVFYEEECTMETSWGGSCHYSFVKIIRWHRSVSTLSYALILPPPLLFFLLLLLILPSLSVFLSISVSSSLSHMHTLCSLTDPCGLQEAHTILSANQAHLSSFFCFDQNTPVICLVITWNEYFCYYHWWDTIILCQVCPECQTSQYLLKDWLTREISAIKCHPRS